MGLLVSKKSIFLTSFGLWPFSWEFLHNKQFPDLSKVILRHKGLKTSVLDVKDIAFYECSEIMRTENFTIFTVHGRIF